jgi:hypothetical protein
MGPKDMGVRKGTLSEPMGRNGGEKMDRRQSFRPLLGSHDNLPCVLPIDKFISEPTNFKIEVGVTRFPRNDGISPCNFLVLQPRKPYIKVTDVITSKLMILFYHKIDLCYAKIFSGDQQYECCRF